MSNLDDKVNVKPQNPEEEIRDYKCLNCGNSARLPFRDPITHPTPYSCDVCGNLYVVYGSK